MKLVALRFALLGAFVSLTFAPDAFAAAAPPSLAKELPVCEQRYGTPPSEPVNMTYPGGFQTNMSELTPGTIAGVTTVNAKVVNCLIESMGSELVVFAPMKDPEGIPEARAYPGYGMGRELDAQEKELVYSTFKSMTRDRKDRPILVYCHSTKCFLSYNALLHLKAAGYTNLLWLRDGIKGWMAEGLPVGHVRLNGTEWLPDEAIPTGKWDAFGDTNYPTPPNHYDRKRWDPLEATGVDQFDLCSAISDREKAPDPGPLRARYESELLLYRAAGVNFETDNEIAVRRKMQAYFAKYGDLLECSELYVGYKSIFKYAALADQQTLILRAIDEWKLPVEVFNKVDRSDGRTLLDYVASLSYYGGASDVTRLYRKLRKAGAMTRAELVQTGKIRTIEAEQEEVLKQWRSAADGGDIDAMFHLAYVYRTGAHVVINRAEGMKWWDRAGQRAIETGHWHSMISMATAYYFSKDKTATSIETDENKARLWIERAIPGDNKDTNFWAGRMYLHGIGMPPDIGRAIPYLERSMQQGNDVAIKWLAEANIDLGNRERAAYFLRSWGMVMDVKGKMTYEWFKILNVKFCGPRPIYEQIVCDGTNDDPPRMF